MGSPCWGAPQQGLMAPNSSEFPDVRLQYRVVAEHQAFQSAMRAADNINTQESMMTSMTINSNTGQRKGVEAACEAQNQDNARRPQAIQMLYRQ